MRIITIFSFFNSSKILVFRFSSGKGCGAPPEKEGCLQRDEENNDPRPTVVKINGQTCLPLASSHDAQKQTEKTINKHESQL
jgi:hypothetical protein